MNPFIRRISEDVPMLMTERFMWMQSFSEKDLQVGEHPYVKRIRESLKPEVAMVGDVAVVPIEGPLAFNPDVFEMLYFGVEDSRAVLKSLNDVAANPDVKGVLIKMDTPGGMMLGGPEIGDAVAEMKKTKPVVTHIGGVGASLGYMIASQSTQIIASRSAMVGSIGVIASVTDWTKYLEDHGIKIEVFTNKEAKFKAAGAIGTSLNDEQRSHIQSRIDSAFSVFRKMVTSARPQVKAEAMQGQVFRGEEAVKNGLVDFVGSESSAMALLKHKISRGPARAGMSASVVGDVSTAARIGSTDAGDKLTLTQQAMKAKGIDHTQKFTFGGILKVPDKRK